MKFGTVVYSHGFDLYERYPLHPYLIINGVPSCSRLFPTENGILCSKGSSRLYCLEAATLRWSAYFPCHGDG